jgi:hypothetical protein
MRFINLSKLRDTADNLGWDAIKQRHVEKLKPMSPAEKKEYINKNPDWNLFQADMLALSHNKCWYSEGPIGNNDFEVDHFRPKNCAKYKQAYNLIYKGNIITSKPNGYWWLAYDYNNFRLTGALANKLRRDRLGENNEVKGKGEYFPLDLVNGKIADDEGVLSVEEPILLDPTNAYDVSLLSFDKGIAIPATTIEEEIDRVLQSIYYYHLDLEQLNTARKIVWNDCVDQIEDAKKAIDEALNYPEKKRMMAKCFRELRKLTDSETRSYTAVAKSCLAVYAQLTGYHWLKDIVRTI